MKKDIHPEYNEVVFQDVSCGKMFLTRSTQKSDDTIEYEGKEYPLIKIEISSASHPFFTGQQKFVDKRVCQLQQFAIDKLVRALMLKTPLPYAGRPPLCSEH